MPELMRLLRSVRGYRWKLAGGLLMMLGVGFFEAVTALLIAPIFDRVLAPQAPDSKVVLTRIPWLNATIYLDQVVPSWMHNVWTIVAVFVLGVAIGKALCEYAANYLINFVGYSVIMDLRNQLYEKILGQSIGFYHKYSTGMLMSTVLSDIERIQLAVSQVLADFMRQAFTLVGLLLVVILIDWRLATVSLTLIPFVMIPSARIGKRIRSSTRKSQDNLAELSQLLQETISGNRIVKAFRMEHWELRRFKEAAQRLLRMNLRYASAQAAKIGRAHV